MKARVLIVDDHDGFRDFARTVLHGAAFAVVASASTGSQALDMVRSELPDVVLLDVQLPDTDGFAVCRTVRMSHPDVVVVLCSVRPASDYGSAVSTCGAKGFLPKDQLSVLSLSAIVGGR